MSAVVIQGMQNSSSSSLQPVGSAGSSSSSSSRFSNSRSPATGGSRCLSSRQLCLGMPYLRSSGLGICGLGHKTMVAAAVGGQHVAVPASSQAPAAATRLGGCSSRMRRCTSHVTAAQRRKLFGVSEGCQAPSATSDIYQPRIGLYNHGFWRGELTAEFAESNY